MKQHWLIRVGQGSALFTKAVPVAQLLVETESEVELSRPDTHHVFEAIDSLKIITAPPVSFIISPVDAFTENDLSLGPDWLGDNIRVWVVSRNR
jgi:hypothetical protein